MENFLSKERIPFPRGFIMDVFKWRIEKKMLRFNNWKTRKVEKNLKNFQK